MNITESYTTNVQTARIDENNIPSVKRAMELQPLIKQSITNSGIYLHAKDITNIVEHFDDEVLFQLSVSIGDVDPTCFCVGVHSLSKDAKLEDIVESAYNDTFLDFICKIMIDFYAPLYLDLPSPFAHELHKDRAASV